MKQGFVAIVLGFLFLVGWGILYKFLNSSTTSISNDTCFIVGGIYVAVYYVILQLLD